MAERNWIDRFKGTKAYAVLLAMKSRGQQISVPSEVSELRSESCIKCPLNRRTSSSALDKTADRTMESLVEGERNKHDPKLHNCKVCTCSLKALTRLTDNSLKEIKGKGYSFSKHERSKRLEGHRDCWLRKLFP